MLDLAEFNLEDVKREAEATFSYRHRLTLRACIAEIERLRELVPQWVHCYECSGTGEGIGGLGFDGCPYCMGSGIVRIMP